MENTLSFAENEVLNVLCVAESHQVIDLETAFKTWSKSTDWDAFFGIVDILVKKGYLFLDTDPVWGWHTFEIIIHPHND